ncbi:hypothetical protein BG015_010447 [Linnemannia schmuckeri]|uniref:NodB homology domain-containing protein n=1 Tax=Linnemannia schmuckeri TaxID=64567 RepID=A0A9P5V983_9FUNG|nr:hypothetical protein BG015_010447 [Linnemannia schmuckeri]
MAPIARIAMAVRAVSEAAAGIKLVYKCTVPNTMAITFDDGPFDYTADLVKLFKKKNAKATFFVNGDNNGKITDYATAVKQAYLDGHQIASHTWSHGDLATMSVGKINEEMNKLDVAIKKIIGVSPTYMRPPYGSINDRVTKTVGARYTIVMWSQDTNDWQHVNDYKKSLKVYTDNIKKANGKPGDIVLQHDTIQMTAKELAPRAIDYAQKMGWKLVTVGECLGKPKSTWYRK